MINTTTDSAIKTLADFVKQAGEQYFSKFTVRSVGSPTETFGILDYLELPNESAIANFEYNAAEKSCKFDHKSTQITLTPETPHSDKWGCYLLNGYSELSTNKDEVNILYTDDDYEPGFSLEFDRISSYVTDEDLEIEFLEWLEEQEFDFVSNIRVPHQGYSQVIVWTTNQTADSEDWISAFAAFEKYWMLED